MSTWLSSADAGQTISWSRGALLLVVISVCIAATVHRIRNDPLRQFSGPVLARFSNILHCHWFVSGRQPLHFLELHEKYGPVVRTAPNELSFSTAASWRDIYGHRQGHRPFVKSPLYNGLKFAGEVHTLVSEQDVGRHATMRKYLSHAFSDRALKEQEGVVNAYVDEFVTQLDKRASEPEGADMVMCLAFGQPFDGLTSVKFHDWINHVTGALRNVALADTLQRFPAFALLFMKVMPGPMLRMLKDVRSHEAYTMKVVQKRLEKGTDRPDFMTRILDNRDSKGLSDMQLAAHASDFVIAGSETTSTVLSTATFYLLKDSPRLKRLQHEVRTTFQTYDELDANSSSKLEYLHATVLEAMRIYPAVPLALARVVPQGGDTVDGYHIPEGTTVSTQPVGAALSTANFARPLEYMPERWIASNAQDKLDASQPFSIGPRGCIGRNLAWLELGLIFAKIV